MSNTTRLVQLKDLNGENITPIVGVDQISGLESVGNVYQKLLWENPNPSSEFAAQTIELDLSNFDEVKILCKIYVTSNYYDIMQLPIGGKKVFEFINNINVVDGVSFTSRNCICNTNNIEFEQGYSKLVSTEALEVNDSWFVPLKIYGIKLKKKVSITEDEITLTDIVPIERGGTGSMTDVGARANLNASPKAIPFVVSGIANRNTFGSTGIKWTCPVNAILVIQGRVIWAYSPPSEVGLAGSVNGTGNIIAYADANGLDLGSLTCTCIQEVTAGQTFYLWASWRTSSDNNGQIRGYYIPIE